MTILKINPLTGEFDMVTDVDSLVCGDIDGGNSSTIYGGTENIDGGDSL